MESLKFKAIDSKDLRVECDKHFCYMFRIVSTTSGPPWLPWMAEFWLSKLLFPKICFSRSSPSPPWQECSWASKAKMEKRLAGFCAILKVKGKQPMNCLFSTMSEVQDVCSGPSCDWPGSTSWHSMLMFNYTERAQVRHVSCIIFLSFWVSQFELHRYHQSMSSHNVNVTSVHVFVHNARNCGCFGRWGTFAAWVLGRAWRLAA